MVTASMHSHAGALGTRNYLKMAIWSQTNDRI